MRENAKMKATRVRYNVCGGAEKMQITIVDIAKELNVSHSTVSRVINNRTDRFISERTRQRVLDACRKMGYQPNTSARALVTGKTHRIGFWAPSLDIAFFQEVANTFRRLVRQSNYDLVTMEMGFEFTDSFRKGLSRSNVDGTLMYGSELGGLQDILETGFPGMAPVVNLGPLCKGRIDSVTIDLYDASRHAMEHLVQMGRQRIAHVLTDFTRNDQDDRYRAYGEVVGQAGREPEYIVVPHWSKPVVRQALCDYIRRNGCPDALFCANDTIAIGAYRGLLDLGLRVPADVALVGCDGIEDIEFLEIPLSTIAQPLDAMCRQAWQFLLRRMEKRDQAPQTAVLTANFIARRSSPLVL